MFTYCPLGDGDSDDENVGGLVYYEQQIVTDNSDATSSADPHGDDWIDSQDDPYFRAEVAYMSLESNVKLLKTEVLSVLEEQRMLARSVANGDMSDLKLSVCHTYFDSIAAFCHRLRALTDQWLRIYATLELSRTGDWRFDERLAEYVEKTYAFYVHITTISDAIVAIYTGGVPTLLRLAPAEISEEFVNDFVHALSDYNQVLTGVAKLDSITGDTCMHRLPPPFSLDGVLEYMAVEDGKRLSKLLFDRLTSAIDDLLLQPLADMKNLTFDDEMVVEFIQKSWTGLPVCQRQKESSSSAADDKTSDYCTNSTSSNDHTDTDPARRFPALKPDHQLRNSQLRSDLHPLYTSFLETRYTVLLTLIDRISKYKTLNSYAKQPKQNSRRISWLDKCLKRQRRKLWRAYVVNMWSHFLSHLVSMLTKHLRAEPAALIQQLKSLDRTQDFMCLLYDIVTAVALPVKITPPNFAMDSFYTVYQQFIVEQATAKLKINLLDDQLTTADTVDDFPVSRFGRQLASCYRLLNCRPLTDVPGCCTAVTIDGRLRTELIDVAGQWLTDRCTAAITKQDFASYVRLRYGDARVVIEQCPTKNDDTGKRPTRVGNQNINFDILLRKQDLLQSKQVAQNTDMILQQYFPGQKYWACDKKSSPPDSTLVQHLLEQILSPAINAAVHLSAENSQYFVRNISESLLNAWITHIFTSRVKISANRALHLESDFRCLEHSLERCGGGMKLTTLCTALAGVRLLQRRGGGGRFSSASSSAVVMPCALDEVASTTVMAKWLQLRLTRIDRLNLAVRSTLCGSGADS